MNNPNLNYKWTTKQLEKGEELRALVVANGGTVAAALLKLQAKGYGFDSVGQIFFAGERVPSPVDRDGRLMPSWDAKDAGGGMRILHY